MVNNNIFIDEDSFLKITQIGWIDYRDARLRDNKLLGIELPLRKKNGKSQYYKMLLSDVIVFIKNLNEAKENHSHLRR